MSDLYGSRLFGLRAWGLVFFDYVCSCQRGFDYIFSGFNISNSVGLYLLGSCFSTLFQYLGELKDWPLGVHCIGTLNPKP